MLRRLIPLITGILFVVLVVVSIFTGPSGSATDTNAPAAKTRTSVILSFAAFIGMGVWTIVTAIMMYVKLGKASDSGAVSPQRKDFKATV